VTEDEDGLELTPALDAAILRTLGKIRRKEGVYGSEKVLEEELGRAEQAAQKKGITGKVPSRTTEKVSLL
jgi:protein KRI1